MHKTCYCINGWYYWKLRSLGSNDFKKNQNWEHNAILQTHEVKNKFRDTTLILTAKLFLCSLNNMFPFYDSRECRGQIWIWLVFLYEKSQPKAVAKHHLTLASLEFKMSTLMEIMAWSRSGSRLGWVKSDETRISSFTNSNCSLFWMRTFFMAYVPSSAKEY